MQIAIKCESICQTLSVLFQLSESVLKSKLESEEVLLRELEEKVKSPLDLALLSRRDRWQFILPELTLAVEAVLAKKTSSDSQDPPEERVDEAEMASILQDIRKCIDEKNYELGFTKLRLVETLLPGAAELRFDFFLIIGGSLIYQAVNGIIQNFIFTIIS